MAWLVNGDVVEEGRREVVWRGRAYSGPFRTPIPAHSGHRFRLIPDTPGELSERLQRGIPKCQISFFPENPAKGAKVGQKKVVHAKDP